MILNEIKGCFEEMRGEMASFAHDVNTITIDDDFPLSPTMQIVIHRMVNVFGALFALFLCGFCIVTLVKPFWG